ncbi:MAG: aldehyde dehydrogenase EutE [Planctomycetia bacterium]|nr:aldehyde dehydrogenase EutE [Planctomycetia bacterium]
MKISENTINKIVAEVIQQMGGTANPPAPTRSYVGHFGQFTDLDDAVQAARYAFEQLEKKSIAERRMAIDAIRNVSNSNAVELGTMEMHETKIGRLDHKIEKQQGVGRVTPGIEFLRSECFSGDCGLTVIEHAPYGVIAAVSPVTHSLPTVTCNAINMISAGNTIVFSPHPGGKKIASLGVKMYNQAIYDAIGIDNLMTILTEPTVENVEKLFAHELVSLINVTGGPAVGRVALRQQKRAIVSGPGNPPVVVDETADLDRAARGIIYGASYDNNLLCLAEKEVFAVESIFDELMDAMNRAGAYRLSPSQVEAFTERAITWVGEGADRHPVPSRDFLGQSPHDMGQLMGWNIPENVELLYGETDEFNPFVTCEQMLPFLPFVRAKDVDDAIRLAVKYEHGFHHTGIMHSRNVENLTRMGKALDTTIFVKNGASVAGLGNGGEGYASYSIAGCTGEGITNPLVYTRSRRCTLVDSLHILGK